jgi:hypothetical protein
MSSSSDENERARVAAPVIADSLRSARAGDLVLLDARGQVLSRRSRRGRAAWQWGWFGLGVSLIGGIWGTLLHSVAAGVVVAGLVTAIQVGKQWRGGRIVRQAAVLLATGRREEARAALDTLGAKKLGEQQRLYCDRIDYLIAWSFGQHEAALATCERTRVARGAYWNAAFDRAQLLAIVGRLREARAAQQQLARAPRGDFFRMQRIAFDLRIAFLANALPEGLSSETLHDWAREALLTNRFGRICVLLAWAFERDRDPEMSRHMLAEAPSRLTHSFLPDSDPPLNAWFIEATARAAETPDPG